MDESRRWFASPYRHLRRIYHELRPHVGVHRPSDDLARVGVKDEGQIQDPFPRRYVRDVRQPDPVGPTGHEVPAKQIRGGSSPWITAGGCALLTPHTVSKPCGSHQASYPPASASYSKRRQLGVYPRVTVGLAAAAMDLADPLGEGGVLLGPLRRRPAAPGLQQSTKPKQVHIAALTSSISAYRPLRCERSDG
jgi:hypothetical protein